LSAKGIKRSGILRRFQKCAEVLSLAKGEKNFTEDLIFQELRKFSKKEFFREKNLWELLDARDLHIFEISVKFCFFLYPLRPILKTFFSTLIRVGVIFWRYKRSNKIETVQYFKKHFFIS
jgi:hypothetical protein